MQFAVAIAVCLSLVLSSIASPVIIDMGKYKIDTDLAKVPRTFGFNPPNSYNNNNNIISPYGVPSSSYSYANMDEWQRYQNSVNRGPGYFNQNTSADQGYNSNSGSGTYYAKEAKPELEGKADKQ